MFLPFTFHNHDGQAGVSEREEPLQKLCRVRGPAFIRTAGLDRQSQRSRRIISQIPPICSWVVSSSSWNFEKHWRRHQPSKCEAQHQGKKSSRCAWSYIEWIRVQSPANSLDSSRKFSKEVFLGLCSSESEKRDKKIFQGCFLWVIQHPTKDIGNRKAAVSAKRASQWLSVTF